MAATELTQYAIRADGWDEFLDIWRRIVALRRSHGFGVLFALADREKNMFTWAIDHDGDFDAAATDYYADPERQQLQVVEGYVTDYKIRRVQQVALPATIQQ